VIFQLITLYPSIDCLVLDKSVEFLRVRQTLKRQTQRRAPTVGAVCVGSFQVDSRVLIESLKVGPQRESVTPNYRTSGNPSFRLAVTGGWMKRFCQELPTCNSMYPVFTRGGYRDVTKHTLPSYNTILYGITATV